MRQCPTYSQYLHEGLVSTDMYSPSSLTQATLILTLLWETRGALSHCIQLVLRTFTTSEQETMNILIEYLLRDLLLIICPLKVCVVLCRLAQRTFSTAEFLKTHPTVQPFTFCLFQSQWDSSVHTAYMEDLGRPEIMMCVESDVMVCCAVGSVPRASI